jgi:hypothetical protein
MAPVPGDTACCLTLAMPDRRRAQFFTSRCSHPSLTAQPEDARESSRKLCTLGLIVRSSFRAPILTFLKIQDSSFALHRPLTFAGHGPNGNTSSPANRRNLRIVSRIKTASRRTLAGGLSSPVPNVIACKLAWRRGSKTTDSYLSGGGKINRGAFRLG